MEPPRKECCVAFPAQLRSAFFREKAFVSIGEHTGTLIIINFTEEKAVITSRNNRGPPPNLELAQQRLGEWIKKALKDLEERAKELTFGCTIVEPNFGHNLLALKLENTTILRNYKANLIASYHIESGKRSFISVPGQLRTLTRHNPPFTLPRLSPKDTKDPGDTIPKAGESNNFPMEAVFLATNLISKEQFKWNEIDFVSDRYPFSLLKF